MQLYKIDQYFEFHFSTQRFDTGAVTDADALPIYRVYEENNDTVIETANCAKVDDANTTGYYRARGQCTAVLGYEVGKVYQVRVTATVNSVAGAGVVGSFTMLPALVYDSLVGGSDNLQVDTVSIANDAITAAAIANGAIDAATFAAGAIDAAAIADAAIDAATFAGNAITSTVIADDAITAAKINTGAFTADAFAADALVAATFATDSITADAIAADAITEIQTGLALEATSLLIKAKTDNLPSGVAKGVALSAFEFVMVDTTDHITPMLGLAPVGTISKDGGAFAPLTNAVAEVGSGVYKVDLTAAEMNADVITLLFTAALADTRIVTILTS